MISNNSPREGLASGMLLSPVLLKFVLERRNLSVLPVGFGFLIDTSVQSFVSTRHSFLVKFGQSWEEA